MENILLRRNLRGFRFFFSCFSFFSFFFFLDDRKPTSIDAIVLSHINLCGFLSFFFFFSLETRKFPRSVIIFPLCWRKSILLILNILNIFPSPLTSYLKYYCLLIQSISNIVCCPKLNWEMCTKHQRICSILVWYEIQNPRIMTVPRSSEILPTLLFFFIKSGFFFCHRLRSIISFFFFYSLSQE